MASKKSPTHVTVRVRRHNPGLEGEPYFQQYTVPLDRGATVLSVLRYIYEELDRSLAYYCSCRIGRCAGCHVSVNGKTRLACTTAVRGDLVLEPMPGYPVVKDLVVDGAARPSRPGSVSGPA
ncbi:MAG: 2Fe-2S iron-sulfur cluster-binding protein [Bacillota bacterium]